MCSVGFFPLVCLCVSSHCASKNEIFCLAGQGLINHSSALYFVTATISATSCGGENPRGERKERQGIISLNKKLKKLKRSSQAPYYLRWNLEITLENIFDSSEG